MISFILLSASTIVLVGHLRFWFRLNGCRIYVDDITGKNCRQFRLPFPLTFIGWAVYPVGGVEKVKEGDGEDRYFSPLQSSLYYKT